LKKGLRKSPTRPRPAAVIAELRTRLVEVEETLQAICNGEVDTVVVNGTRGRQVFALEGVERSYRVLIESMNEGAVTLTADKMILYANDCFARMVKAPLEQVTGSSFGRFLSADHLTLLKPLLESTSESGAKIQVFLKATDGSRIPVQISVRPMPRSDSRGATMGMVVSDLSETYRTQEMMRALAQRVLQAQETERGRVALELHDHITQLLCAIAFESRALFEKLSKSHPGSRHAGDKLNHMLGEAGEEVERISRNLRPSLLAQLGLVAVLRASTKEFQKRTGIPVELSCAPLPVALTPDTELTLYRILQEALSNVEKHARPKKVSVTLNEDLTHVHLVISDDGIGFDPDSGAAGPNVPGRLGLLGMRERATYVRGVCAVKSSRDAGTTVEVRIPLALVAISPAEPS
jgi:two-component system NarL family sensor kinase